MRVQTTHMSGTGGGPPRTIHFNEMERAIIRICHIQAEAGGFSGAVEPRIHPALENVISSPTASAPTPTVCINSLVSDSIDFPTTSPNLENIDPLDFDSINSPSQIPTSVPTPSTSFLPSHRSSRLGSSRPKTSQPVMDLMKKQVELMEQQNKLLIKSNEIEEEKLIFKKNKFLQNFEIKQIKVKMLQDLVEIKKEKLQEVKKANSLLLENQNLIYKQSNNE